ncbi:MAG: SBBP repeat-containing protein [Bryobacteraceae bacterium]
MFVTLSLLLGLADCDSAAYGPQNDIFLACHSPGDQLEVTSQPPLTPAQQAAKERMDGYVLRFRPSTGKVLWATRIGGSDLDLLIRIAVDRRGFAYAAGFTKSADFPVTTDALQSRLAGKMDACFVKLTADGRVLYSTLLGGSGDDQGDALAIDASGTVYLGGTTWSPDFPGQSARAAAKGDAWVAALDLAGRIRSTVFGGSGEEKLTGIALDGRGALFATGFTPSPDFPTAGALQPQLRGPSDAFLTRLAIPSLEITYSTYYGGPGEDSAWGVTIDGSGHPIIAGRTGGFERALPGSDAFVATFGGPELKTVRVATFGGSGMDSAGYDGQNVAIDRWGNVWFVGETHSPDLPVRNAFQPKFGGGDGDGFLAALSPDLNRVCFASYFGGPGREVLEGVAISRAGQIFATAVAFGANAPNSIAFAGTTVNNKVLAFKPGNPCR